MAQRGAVICPRSLHAHGTAQVQAQAGFWAPSSSPEAGFFVCLLGPLTWEALDTMVSKNLLGDLSPSRGGPRQAVAPA